MYFNELDLLKYRIAHCYDHVDKFVIIDSKETHRGVKRKPLDYSKIDSKYKNKIIYDCITFPQNLTITKDMDDKKREQIAWEREYYQRDQISKHIKGLKDDDLCIVSDLDEICDYSILLKYLTEKNLFHKLVHHINPTFVFNIHFLQIDYWHACSFSSPVKLLRDKSLSHIRFKELRRIDGVPIDYKKTVMPDNFDITKSCFKHFNRFLNPLDLFKKQNAMVEGGDDHALNVSKYKKFTKFILLREHGNLKYVEYTFPKVLYDTLHRIHTMTEKEFETMWASIKDLSDDSFMIWYKNFFMH